MVKTDSEKEVERKLRIVAAFLDIRLHAVFGMGNPQLLDEQYNMFQAVILKIRSKSKRWPSIDRESARGGRVCHQRAVPPAWSEWPPDPSLARPYDRFRKTQADRQSRYPEYIQRGRNGYEVEHIWADHPKRHEDEFSHPEDFAEYRNRIGGLLLLPRSFNASYGDMPYANKREHYYGQNLLAQSLHERAYENNPGFERFRERTGLKFRSHTEFRKADLDTRQKLYLALAEQIWNPDRLQEIAEDNAE